MKFDFLKKKRTWINKLFPTSMFPLTVEDFWLCGYWYDKPRKVQMKYFDHGKYVKWKVGDTTALFKKNGYKAIYKITRIKRPYGDYADYDDGTSYWLKLKRVVKI